MSDPTFVDVLLSVGIGLSIGWFVGGCWNVMQGRRWNGKPSEAAGKGK